jgi:zinc protease
VTRADRTRLPEPGLAPRFRFPGIRKHHLSGRLSLWTVEQRALPVVTFVLILPVGSAADPEDRHGLAALTGDMLDEGSGERSALDVCEALARLGARFDTEVTADATALTVTVLAPFRARALSLLADCVVRPRLDERDFERVRRLRATRLMQLRDIPSAVADWAFMRLLYGSHPYGHLALGSEAALRQMSIDDVRAFHHTACVPSGATLIAVGDIDADDHQQMAAEAFGEWVAAGPGRGAAAPGAEGRTAVPPPAPDRFAIVHKAGAAQAELRIGHVGVARDTPDYHALLVLNAVLGGQYVSRINRKLRQEKGYTYGARTAFDFRLGRGPFLLQTAVQTEVTGEAIREAMGELLAIRGNRPPTPQELDLAKATLTRGYARNFETPDQIARAIAQLVLYRLPDDHFDEFVARVDGVDHEAARHAATTYIDPDRLVTVIVGDSDAIRPRLAGTGLGEPAAVTAGP